MRTMVVAVVVTAAVAASSAVAASPPKHLIYASPALLSKMERALRDFDRVYYGVRLAPGRCVPKGPAVDSAGRAGYRRVECSWNGGWRSFYYVKPKTGKLWARACDRTGDCATIGR